MAEEKKAQPSRSLPLAADHVLIVRPIITEKTTAARERLGKYTFEVADHATKRTVQGAVQRLFNVKVTKVNMVHRPGKTRRVRSVPGLTKSTKRAIVTLEAGQKIAFFEGL